MRANVSLAIATLAGVLACDKAGPSGVPPPPAPTPTSTVVRISISGPGSIPPGGTGQFTATALMSNGTTQDVTSAAVWESHHPSVLSVERGVATAHARGEADIAARWNQGFGFIGQILVLPDGTYRVSGRVLDAGYGLADAKVEVVSGPGAGLAAITESCIGCGGYALYGVSGNSTIRVTKDGYETRNATLNIGRNERLDFDLIPVTAPPDPSGAYRLIITAADECRSALPPELQERAYDAVVTRDGRRLKVTLDAPTLEDDGAGNGKGLLGAVEANRVIFSLPKAAYSPWDLYFYYGAIMERVVPAPAKLSISGAVTAIHSPGSISGTLNGTMVTGYIVGESIVPLASCRSANHRFVFQR
jgi:hypothetical protein